MTVEEEKGEQVEERFVVRKSGPGYEWLPAFCIVDTEKQVRASAYDDEDEANRDCDSRNWGDEFYLCLHCGSVAHTNRWTLWIRDYEVEGGFRPFDQEKDDDGWVQCPGCGERHGDSYECAGVEDGTLDQCQAAHAGHLRDDPAFFVGAAQ